jgi:[acyl-carrier-protein] S-malonyltransferase
MGKAWFERAPAAREVFERADAILGSRLGTPLSTLCFDGPEGRLNQTDASQPAIFVTSMACWAGLLAQQGKTTSDSYASLVAAAGLSLGEYTALTIAGAFSFEDALELVVLRGRAMQDAADSPLAREGGGGGMLALIGATDEQAEQIAGKAAQGQVLVCANYNAPGQVVLSGHKHACDRAGAIAAEMGVRSAPLAVAGAFHSPLMAPAAERLDAALAKVGVGALRCPVVSNVTARPYETGSAGEVRQRLVEQLTQPVRWAQSCQWIASTLLPARPGVECHELAPGKVLMGLMRRIDKGVKVITHEEA